MRKRAVAIAFAVIILPSQLLSQESNLLPMQSNYSFKPTQIILPASLIALGSFGVWNKQVKELNVEIKEGVANWRNKKIHIDDYAQYVPMASVYGLSLLGAKAKHSYGERTVIMATAYLCMGLLTNSTKQIVGNPRPDTGAKNSFPSGHTATAFVGAELLRIEYGEQSPWFGIGAYSVACGVGLFRIYNERHWLTDVIAGAGVGILSARIGYWLLPVYKNLFQKQKTKQLHTTIVPFYDGKSAGISATLRF